VLRECVAFNQLEDENRNTIELFEPVDRSDVRMIEGSKKLASR
jgi:hypothetical protein